MALVPPPATAIMLKKKVYMDILRKEYCTRRGRALEAFRTRAKSRVAQAVEVIQPIRQPGIAIEGLCRVNTLEFPHLGAVSVYYRINRVVACDKVRSDGLSPLRCLVEAAVCVSPARAEKVREHYDPGELRGL